MTRTCLPAPHIQGRWQGSSTDYGPKLLRASDADAVLASAQAYRTIENNTRFVAAAARLRGLEDVERAADSLKIEIQRIPISLTLGLRDQSVLAFALWQMRGAPERSFLADWFYTALPFTRSPDALEYFLRDGEREARPDTSLLLMAIAGDARFEQVGWSPLARILDMVNRTLPSPLVDSETRFTATCRALTGLTKRTPSRPGVDCCANTSVCHNDVSQRAETPSRAERCTRRELAQVFRLRGAARLRLALLTSDHSRITPP